MWYLNVNPEASLSWWCIIDALGLALEPKRSEKPRRSVKAANLAIGNVFFALTYRMAAVRKRDSLVNSGGPFIHLSQ